MAMTRLSLFLVLVACIPTLTLAADDLDTAGLQVLGAECDGESEEGRDARGIEAAGEALDVDRPGLALGVVRHVADLVVQQHHWLRAIQAGGVENMVGADPAQW